MKIYKTFEEFILALNVLDNEAAKYIGEEYIQYRDNNQRGIFIFEKGLETNYRLKSMFCWADSPQGHNYWKELDIKMMGVNWWLI